jgi:hypothetical protein
MSDLVSFTSPALGQSPFDQFRSLRPDQTEFWSARGLQVPFGYARWENFEDAIKKAINDFLNMGYDPSDHFRQTTKMIGLGKGARRAIDDYELSRQACYIVAMNCRTEEGSVAKGYFAAQTRRAELHLSHPRTVAQEARPWSSRITPSFEAHRLFIVQNCPPGAWSVLTASLAETLMTEDELIRHCLPIEHHDLPDGSIGRMYKQHRRAQGWDFPISTAPLVHPNWRKVDGADVTVYPAAYLPDERWLFEKWLYRCYFPQHLPKYLEKKFDPQRYGLAYASAADNSSRRIAGRRSALQPYILREIDAAGGRILATAQLEQPPQQGLLFNDPNA